MRRVIGALVLACACGGSSAGGKAMLLEESEPPRPISVEWRVSQGEGHQVDVALAVDGTSTAIGSLAAATEYEPGTPATCALRAASPRRTEIVCGDANGFRADLVDSELVVLFVAGDRRDEVKRIPVHGDVLAVKPLALPLDDATGR